MFITSTPDWMYWSACVSWPGDWWFPDNTQKGEDVYASARRVCMRCPVRIDCLDYAQEHDEKYGMWGGLTPRQRLMDKKRPSKRYRQP